MQPIYSISIFAIMMCAAWYITFIAFLIKIKRLRSAERFIYTNSGVTRDKNGNRIGFHYKDYEDFKKHF